MPPSKHAVLSASGAHRWLHCNPSARLELEFADRETEAAAEGTAAHALAEHKLKKALKLRSRKPVSPYDCDEMDAYTDGYVEFVLEQLEEGTLDLALGSEPQDSVRFGSDPVFRQELVVLTPKTARWQTVSSLSLEQVAAQPLILHTRNTGMQIGRASCRERV